MSPELRSSLVDLQPLGWSTDRIAAALAVAVPNNQRIAQAAQTQLTLDDHAAGFAAWCDAQARDRDRDRNGNGNNQRS